MKPIEDLKKADEVQKTTIKKAKKVKVIISKQEEIIDFANLIVKSGKVNKVEEDKPIVISPLNPNILSVSPHEDIITSPL